MKVGFIVVDINQISGGGNVVIEYANGLRLQGAEVYIISMVPFKKDNSLWHEKINQLNIVDINNAVLIDFDIVFATWWMTYFELGRINSKIYAYLNQSYESRFHQVPILKFLNRTTYSLPLLILTEAQWLKNMINEVNPEAKIIYLQNGLCPNTFPIFENPSEDERCLRILVEGPEGIPYKKVNETFKAIQESLIGFNDFKVGWLSSDTKGKTFSINGKEVQIYEKIPLHSVKNVLREYDVIIKLSSVEGMFGPPLEMFSQGGIAITSNVTGNEEYMIHGYNGFILQSYNSHRIGHYIKLLHRDRKLLKTMKANALKTAQQFPSWDQQSKILFMQLQELVNTGWTNAHLRAGISSHSLLKDVCLSSADLPFNTSNLQDYEFAVLRLIKKARGIKLFKILFGVFRSFLNLIPKKEKV